MDTPTDLSDTNLTIWRPWSQKLCALIDAIRAVSSDDVGDKLKRQPIAQLGGKVQSLLESLDGQPDLPGVYGDAIRLLRSPVDADAIPVSDAIDRICRLAHRASIEPVVGLAFDGAAVSVCCESSKNYPASNHSPKEQPHEHHTTFPEPMRPRRPCRRGPGHEACDITPP